MCVAKFLFYSFPIHGASTVPFLFPLHFRYTCIQHSFKYPLCDLTDESDILHANTHTCIFMPICVRLTSCVQGVCEYEYIYFHQPI